MFLNFKSHREPQALNGNLCEVKIQPNHPPALRAC